MVLQNSGRYRPDKSESSTNDGGAGGSRDDSSESRIRTAIENDRIDSKYGFDRVRGHIERTGFLINMHSTEILDEDKRLIAAMDYYFIEMDGSRFKVSLAFQPYFLIAARKECEQEVILFLSKKYAGVIFKIETLEKEDLDLPNHLSNLQQRYIKLSFVSMNDMTKVRRDLLTAANKNKEREKTDTIYTEMLTNAMTSAAALEHAKKTKDHMENIIDIREHDVPFHVRVSIDLKIFCGLWYTVKTRGTESPLIIKREDLLERPDPIVLAFDIETTKLPLKFPDSQTDQIMMISYMIDGQGYLITNREIISSDVEDFEYTPKPEFEGLFVIFNEVNEKALLQKFFDHILDIKPHIFVTYNGDFFDWPFIETRAEIHGLDMKREIGFSKVNSRDGTYLSRPAMHMDCLCWVKRDSYLPVGSQGLKAVAKAKLRYDPVELDPEDMCKMATEQPQVLSNYSVSDAVATYYLYMKYVHPFIFALCTIIPQEPDEVLRKGSGTLCESLLMVEAFHANIVFPNKQIEQLNKLTPDGHLLEQETYVGGHVEALESGVFRADIPCRFRLVPDAFNKLIESIAHVMKHAIEVEEEVPLHFVTNFEDICSQIQKKLEALRDHPNRLENPVIYHLDVGAMYPNIILTNRLQPSAMVNSSTCAVCDHNRPGATCQRDMEWVWRGDYLPASRSEYQRIQQQLETEKFPSLNPGGQPRPFHALPKEDQAAYEKKRLADYCRVAYKKTKVTKEEIKTTTICQKENSFYVDTVRAFRDRRYEYKALNKQAKQKVSEAIASGDAGEIKLAKSCEVLYDSLQLAHKCILNSFYGYVMRRGARWHSMEMAGIVCYTGAHIIMKAREIIEQVGRPLELDTDGIWCVLPASFPETFTVLSDHPKKKKIKVSYPNAVLNAMVKDHFTNDQYHQLEDPVNMLYSQRSENSIFFEVDGPYLGMVLPASKEEGKRLKKRYAVFNFDGTLAELKGFEVKRRGELQIIKIFQSSVFEAFLKGDSLETCYASVAKVADYWLDVLYSKGCNMPDSELFELISENRSMSKKLEEYGAQKSTSISTAKRLAEFLGDQMVKDAGLACKFIISRKPDGSPVTERAIPLAIFQSDPSVKRHHLRRWLKDNSINDDIDIRDVLDWNYYIERLSGAIQKIITIPAAMQGLANPVARVKHPDWLHKKMLEKNDILKQRKISELFTSKPKTIVDNSSNMCQDSEDIEDIGKPSTSFSNDFIKPKIATVKRKRKASVNEEEIKHSTWREALGPPPPFGSTKVERIAWIVFQKKKWAWQAAKRGKSSNKKKGKRDFNNSNQEESDYVIPLRNYGPANTLGGFLKRAQRTLLDMPWQIIQVIETAEPGQYKLWALIGTELHNIRLTVPRVFYVNQRISRPEDQGALWKKCNRILPRGRTVLHLYQYTISEELYRRHQEDLMGELSAPEIEGIYETQMSLEFKILVQLGCICAVDRQEARKLSQNANTESFYLNQLQFKSVAYQPYLKKTNGVLDIKQIYLYQHTGIGSSRAMWSLCLGPTKRVYIFVIDTVKTNQMPNMNALYAAERTTKLNSGSDESQLPPSDLNFEVVCETNIKLVYRLIQRALQDYKEDHKGPTFCAIQSTYSIPILLSLMPGLGDFPLVPIHVRDVETLYASLDWQRLGARAILRHYLNLDSIIDLTLEQCRYFHLPLGNMPADPTLFGADLFYARNLIKHNFVLWCSNMDRPDLGGRETDDNRLISEAEELGGNMHNSSGAYPNLSVELETDSLAVCALMQATQILQIEGTSVATSFGAQPQALIPDALGANTSLCYDESAQCSAAMKVLRTMVGAWLRDVSVYKNVFADFQLSHFYRWLRTPTSILYDPALRRTLHNLMKKLFLQLIAEFKRLGSQIIFANFNKIILSTKKKSVMDAIGYVEFVVQSIRNKEIFHGIEISYKQCWSYLIWLDLANNAGVKGKLPKGLTEVGESHNMDDSQRNQLEDEEDSIEMNWNLMEYLPAPVRDHFAGSVAGFVSAAHTEPEELCSLVRGEISQKLFQLTEKIHKKYPIMEYENDGALMSTQFEGGQRNPALEFVNAICKVFYLVADITDEVDLLRRNLLRLIGIGEFSESATWKDPCASFTICEVICKVCNHCRDIDMCKDNHRDIINDCPVCLCPICGTAYENSELEHRLIEAFNKKNMSYILQDLICTRCHHVKRENLSTVCSCAGDFKLMMSKKDMIKTLKTFRMISKYFKMTLLLEIVLFNLQNT